MCFFLLSASASPLLLPPGQLELTPVAKVGNVTAMAFKEERGGRSPIFFILSTEDGHALFAVNGEKHVPLFSGPGLAPDILADGRFTLIGLIDVGRQDFALVFEKESDTGWGTGLSFDFCLTTFQLTVE